LLTDIIPIAQQNKLLTLEEESITISGNGSEQIHTTSGIHKDESRTKVPNRVVLHGVEDREVDASSGELDVRGVEVRVEHRGAVPQADYGGGGLAVPAESVRGTRRAETGRAGAPREESPLWESGRESQRGASGWFSTRGVRTQ
jgi:hypothetical protein